MPYTCHSVMVRNTHRALHTSRRSAAKRKQCTTRSTLLGEAPQDIKLHGVEVSSEFLRLPLHSLERRPNFPACHCPEWKCRPNFSAHHLHSLERRLNFPAHHYTAWKCRPNFPAYHYTF